MVHRYIIELTDELKGFQEDVDELERKYGAEEVPTGHWEWVQYDANPQIGNFHCSECRYIPAIFNLSAQRMHYCPNCGAKMHMSAE